MLPVSSLRRPFPSPLIASCGFLGRVPSMSLLKYVKLSKIGEGTYGVVFKGHLREDRNDLVALKRIRMDTDEEGIPSTALREITILKELKHPNIVDLKDVAITKTKKGDMIIYLVMEYLDMDFRDFFDKLNQFRFKMEMPMIKSFSKQLLDALLYLHVRRLFHRDLKPQNLLVSLNGQIKLADFGFARAFSLPVRAYTHEVVTLWYRPPEILLGGEHYSTGVDIWSLACIIAEMMFCKPILMGDSEIDQLFKIFQVFGTPAEDTWANVCQMECYNVEFPKWPKKTIAELIPGMDPVAVDFLSSMFELNPHDRATAQRCLGHDFLTSEAIIQHDIKAFLKDLKKGDLENSFDSEMAV